MEGISFIKKKLRFFRILFAIVAFACFLFLFLGGEESAHALADKLLFLQFAPSVVKFFLVGGLASFGFFFVLILTILFGRVYCSVLCPLGILHDFIIFLGRKFGSRDTAGGYHSSPGWLRYFIFAAVGFSAALGTVALLNLLDPYSIFGRIATVLFKPLTTGGSNLLSDVLERFEIYWIWPKYVSSISFTAWALTFVFFAVVVFLALFHGRLYCNTICPVGTLLGILSRRSFLKFRIKPDVCTSCRKCEKLCRSNCIDVENKTIDISRCVACFDCLAVCPVSAVEYSHPAGQRTKELLSPSRRRLITGSVLSAAALALMPVPVRAMLKRDRAKQQHPVMPPGSVNRERFCVACIGCGLCVSLCPERVIKQAFMEYGLDGLMVPVLDYSKGYCAYECNLCGRLCPTGAIKKLELAEKKLVQIGKVQLLKDKCVVHMKDKDCGACAEVCPTHAVYTVVRNNVHYPEINTELCTGCGACENICPVMPKAIIVDGLAEHGVAKEPFYDAKPSPALERESIDEDFPF